VARASEKGHEGSSIGEEDLQKLQGRAAAQGGLHHLHRPAAQAAAGLTIDWQGFFS